MLATDERFSNDRMNALLRFFSHAAIGIIGSIASIIGLGLAFYFYYLSIRAPDLTFHFHPVRTTVVKAGGASALKVSFAGNEVQDDITAVQIAFWNAGKEPVASASILSPIQIKTQNSAAILEATIRRLSRPETKVSLDQSQAPKGTIGVTWGILEQGDGAVIQLIYAGEVTNVLSVSGAVVGQKRLSELKYSGSISSPAEQYAKQVRYNHEVAWVMLGIGALATLTGSFRVFLRRRPDSDSSFRFLPPLIQTMMGQLFFAGLLYAIVGCVALYRAAPPAPPFGF